MNDDELEALLGIEIKAKWLFVLHGERLFHKDGGLWTEYAAA